MRNESVSDEDRERFDAILEALIPTLPPRVRQVMEEVPIVVEDVPGVEARGVRPRDPSRLMGLYVGVPIGDRDFEAPPRLGDVVYLYRLGIMSASRRRCSAIDEARLRDEMRKTILHEIGHYHGMDEEELEDLGY